MTAAPVISVDNLSYRFPRAEADALRHISWQAHDGSVTLVVGPSGAGKTTLLRCLNGLIPHFHGGRFGGDVVVLGRNTRQAAPRDMAAAVGVVFQDPEAQFVTDRVEDELVFGMENLGYDRRTMRIRLEETLDLLGIHHLRGRDVSTLSGGERQRVAIAAALVSRPRLLVLDEPTSQLDPLAAHDVLAAVERLNNDLGMTVVLAEHRLDRVLEFAERIVAVEHGSFREEDVQTMLPTLADVPPLVELARMMDWPPPIPLTIRDARRRIHSVPSQPVARTPSERGDVMLRIEGLTFGYGAPNTLRDINLKGYAGEVIALIGRNGSGKTTLLKLLTGLLRPAKGRVMLNGSESSRLPVHSVARTVGYVPQHPSSILHQETLRDELEFTLRARNDRSGDPLAILRELGLAQHAEHHPLDLSGGERQRAALAALAVGEPPVLLLDEPTRGLPGRDKRSLGAFARRYVAAGRLVIIATHDVEFVAEHADRILMLADGELIADGPPAAILAGSLTFSTQMNRVFGGDILTVADVRPLAIDDRSRVKSSPDEPRTPNNEDR